MSARVKSTEVEGLLHQSDKGHSFGVPLAKREQDSNGASSPSAWNPMPGSAVNVDDLIASGLSKEELQTMEVLTASEKVRDALDEVRKEEKKKSTEKRANQEQPAANYQINAQQNTQLNPQYNRAQPTNSVQPNVGKGGMPPAANSNNWQTRSFGLSTAWSFVKFALTS